MKSSIFNFIKDFFEFSQKEMNGFAIMTAIMISMVVGLVAFNQLSNTNDQDFSKKDAQILDSLLKEIQAQKPIYNDKNDKISNVEENANAIALFSFDPNIASEDEFLALGIKPFLAERILKYRLKGGKFKIKSDFKKMYGLSEEKYAELLPYILLPETKAEIGKNKDPVVENSKPKYPDVDQKYPKKEFKKGDINTADSVTLEKVYGIGFKLASRIIKYREKLGGFVSLVQLKEVWGLDSTAINEIEKKYEIVENFQPKKININNADFQVLKSHPYIGANKAKLILNFKKMHGTYYAIDQLKQIQAISAEEIGKLNPYIEF